MVRCFCFFSIALSAPAAILSEGEEISRVAFIQSGSCTALVRVPRAPRFTQVSSHGNRNNVMHAICITLNISLTPRLLDPFGNEATQYFVFVNSMLGCCSRAQVTVGHLAAGDCIGEGMLRGNDRQPYTIVSTSRLRVGWVTSTTLRGQGKVKQRTLNLSMAT